MQLQMFLDGKLLDAVSIPPGSNEKLNIIQLHLEDKYSDIISLSKEEPEYYIEGISSKMNNGIFETTRKIDRN